MPRTRTSTPDVGFDDPVVEIHESQLNRLRARANLAIPGAVIALLALALITLGIVRVERFARDFNLLVEGRSGVVAQRVDVLTKELESRTDPEYLARVAMEANAAPIAGASNTAQRALTVARRAAASLEPVTEQLTLVDGQLVAVRSELGNLAEQGTAREARIASVSNDLGLLRSSHAEQVASLDRRIKTQQTLLDYQDRELSSNKSWTRSAVAGAAVGIGIATVHALGHGGR
jgi:hypothetical protein